MKHIVNVIPSVERGATQAAASAPRARDQAEGVLSVRIVDNFMVLFHDGLDEVLGRRLPSYSTDQLRSILFGPAMVTDVFEIRDEGREGRVVKDDWNHPRASLRDSLS